MARKNLFRSVAGICAVAALASCTSTTTPPPATSTPAAPVGSASSTPAPSAASSPGAAQSVAPPTAPGAAGGQGTESAVEDSVAAQALRAVDNLTEFEVRVLRTNNRSGLDDWASRFSVNELAQRYDGDKVLEYTINGQPPNKASLAPLSKDDMRLLIRSADYGPENERGVVSGSLRAGTQLPSLGTQLLDTCAQDGTWFITAGSVGYNRRTGVIEYVDYMVETPDFNSQGTLRDASAGEEKSQCRSVWDFRSVNGTVLDKPPAS
ncbi:hypothetical protein R6G73_03815 [Actinotignum sanguinis]|uniref:hypothetical protein n=1 Tax=Actinotignum sanguinis TaxID=1445614 RepID=UPI000F7F5FA7|nr:hypothetical protein [Actinotignum sanguinis]MDY5148009.1 hypothetical protein [Actinotignum sanguinis]